MRMLLLYILLVAFSFQLSAFSCQLSTVSHQLSAINRQSFIESEKRLKANDERLKSQGRKVQSSENSVDCCQLSVDFYESKIRLADSLYKNYLPQYNFEDVKAAVMFFDSVQLSAISRQHRGLFNKKATDENILIAESRLLTAAKAHYYHAVGLTERDDIVGACEHYFIALEIMEECCRLSAISRQSFIESEKLKNTESEKRLKANGERLKSQSRKARSSEKTVDCCLLSVDNPEDYERIRFLSLIYTRLGELFLSENYCDLAISKYRKALRYVLLLGENKAVANTYKCLGNSYQLYDMPDSALYYYNKSLATNSELPNRLDVEKCIAQILFDRGEKDSAYVMIKNNLDKIENVNIIYSYYNILGDMYINDKEYDCAIYYLDKSMNSTISDIRVYAAIKLSSIYNIIGDNIKKAYYDNIVSKILIDYNNSNIETSKLQNIYDRYKERKSEKEKSISRMRTKVIVKSLSLLVFIVFVIIILIWYKSKIKDKHIAGKEVIISKTIEEIKQKESEIKKFVGIIEDLKSDINSLKDKIAIKEHEISSKETDIKNMEKDLSVKKTELEKMQKNIEEYKISFDNLNEEYKTKEERLAAHFEEIEKLNTEINQAQIEIKDLRFRNSFTEGRIKIQNAELKKKEELIRKYTTEITELKNQLDIISSDINDDDTYIPNAGMESYLKSKVCSKILNEINELSARNMDVNRLTPLRHEEFVMLLNTARLYLNNFNEMTVKHSQLKIDDLYYICLVILGLNDTQISSLFALSYTAINKKKKKIRHLFGLNSNDILYTYIIDSCVMC